MPTVEFLSGARLDFDESFDWYAERSAQAALRFAAAVDAALVKIVADPNSWSSRDGVHRECPLKKFPFRVIFRFVDDRVLVVAISHAKRRPGYWRRRK